MNTNGEQNERCETCRFWVPESSECHRHAPGVVPVLTLAGRICEGESHSAAAWPVTAASEWCGEWASADVPPRSAEPVKTTGSVAVRLFLARVAPTLDGCDPAALLGVLLDQLPADVRRVIVRSNGLDGRPAAAPRAIAHEFKISQGHVRALIETGEKLLTEIVRLLTRQREM